MPSCRCHQPGCQCAEQNLNIRRETRVALLMLDTVDYPCVFWGAVRAGIVPVCLNTLLTAKDYLYMLGDSRAEALIVAAPLLPVVAPLFDDLPFLRHVIMWAGAEERHQRPPPARHADGRSR